MKNVIILYAFIMCVGCQAQTFRQEVDFLFRSNHWQSPYIAGLNIDYKCTSSTTSVKDSTGKWHMYDSTASVFDKQMRIASQKFFLLKDGEWSPHDSSAITTDTNGYPSVKTFWRWSEESKDWQLLEEYVYVFDSIGHNMTMTRKNKLKHTGIMDNYSREEHLFDKNDNDTLTISQGWNDSLHIWQSHSRVISTYDNNHHLLSATTFVSDDIVNWKKYKTENWEYDTAGLMTMHSDITYYDDTIYHALRQTTNYNTSKQPLVYNCYAYRCSSSNDWGLTASEQWKYDTIGNIHHAINTILFWDCMRKIELNKSIYTYTYDRNNNLISYMTIMYPNNDDYMTTDKTTISYDSNNNMTHLQVEGDNSRSQQRIYYYAQPHK